MRHHEACLLTFEAHRLSGALPALCQAIAANADTIMGYVPNVPSLNVIWNLANAQPLQGLEPTRVSRSSILYLLIQVDIALHGELTCSAQTFMMVLAAVSSPALDSMCCKRSQSAHAATKLLQAFEPAVSRKAPTLLDKLRIVSQLQCSCSSIAQSTCEHEDVVPCGEG